MPQQQRSRNPEEPFRSGENTVNLPVRATKTLSAIFIDLMMQELM